jgi:predicted transcriptional regulator
MAETYDVEIRKRILVVLQKNPQGLCIAETARLANTTKITAGKHLIRLKEESLVVEYTKDSMRLFVLCEVIQ